MTLHEAMRLARVSWHDIAEMRAAFVAAMNDDARELMRSFR